MARNIREPIPLPVILAASEGDERALNAVLNHYKGYIRFLAMRPMKDEYGNEHLYVDEDMRLRLEAKLLYSIVTGVFCPLFPRLVFEPDRSHKCTLTKKVRTITP